MADLPTECNEVGTLFIMFIVYIIKSVNRDWHYVGMTNNLIDRLKRHNSGRNKSTRIYKPFVLVYKRNFDNRKDAREYEKYLKISSNKEKVLISL